MCPGMNKVVSAHFVKVCQWSNLLATYLAKVIAGIPGRAGNPGHFANSAL